MQRAVIIGAGGHGQVVANTLIQAEETGSPIHTIGYVDDDETLHGKEPLGLPVMGSLRTLSQIEHDVVVVAIGDNNMRREIFDALAKDGEQFLVAKHPRAIVAPDVVLGPGTVVCAGVVISPGTVVGSNTILNTSCTVDHHSHIGAHVHIAPGVHLGGDVHVGDGTLIGIGAIVMPQRRIGAWSIVGAGALIHSDIPDRVIATGVPAKIVQQIDEI